MPYELLPMYVTLRTQHPEQGDLPVPEPLPELTGRPSPRVRAPMVRLGAIALSAG